jgi:hypothetical protein
MECPVLAGAAFRLWPFAGERVSAPRDSRTHLQPSESMQSIRSMALATQQIKLLKHGLQLHLLGNCEHNSFR